ncbi:MAG: polysaccharide lyase [Nitrospirota bacterium]
MKPLRPVIVAIVLGLALSGLSRTASAQILLQEDFEDSNLSSRGWYDMARWGTEQFISTTQARSGSASLEVRYQSGSTGPYMRHQFSGQNRVYTRYYRKWASNWRWSTVPGPHDTYLFAMYGQQYFAPTETYLTVYTDAVYQGLPSWQPGTIGLQTKRSLQGESYRTLTSLSQPPARFVLDQWYCVEVMATMNTPGSSDGRLQLWLDGTPIFDVSGRLLRDANNAGLQFDQFMFGPYFHGGTSQVQSTWIDALVIATERVGCLDASDTTPPSAPTGLVVE